MPKNVTNLYISYTIGPQLRNLDTGFTLGNCLLRSVELTKKADLDKYKYTSYGVQIDSSSKSLFTDGSYGKNVIILGADMSSSVHIDNKNKGALIPGEVATQGLDDTTLISEAKYPTDFTQPIKRFVSNLYYNGINSFVFVNATVMENIYETKSSIK